MPETILLGQGKRIVELPRHVWETHLAHVPDHAGERLGFMSADHHRVRYFVVSELPRIGKPISPATIAQRLALPLAQVNAILDDLEQHLTFLVRNGAGEVAWAYPLTVEATPHAIAFNSGERLYAAWAEDALAAPFVQGQLWQTPLTVTIHTQCKHCGRPMTLEIDHQLNCIKKDEDSAPLVFSPDLDWENFKEPNIIHKYWSNSVFFWSEEHAREYRAAADQVNGAYMTLAQMAFLTPISQGTLFGWHKKVDSWQ